MENQTNSRSTLTVADRRAIRTLWIDDRRDSYSVDFLAELLDLDPDVVKDVGDLTLAGEVEREYALIIAAQLYSASQIEIALGDDATAVLPAGRRTRIVTLRLSSWVVDLLERAAERQKKRGHERDRSIDALLDFVVDNEAEDLLGSDLRPPFEIAVKCDRYVS